MSQLFLPFLFNTNQVGRRGTEQEKQVIITKKNSWLRGRRALRKRQETFSLEVLVPVYFVYCMYRYLNSRRRIKKKVNSPILITPCHCHAYANARFVSLCSLYYFFPSLALPCHEPYIPLHCAYTAYIYPTPV